MNKVSKIALLVSSVLSAQAFAAETGKLDVEVYGKAGVATQLDADTNGSLDSRTDEDISAYEDSKIGLKLGYGFNKNFSIHTEIKSDFEGHDAVVRIQELYLKADIEKFDMEIGRLRTPLYMNSTVQDDDFALNTYRGVRGFSTQSQVINTIDGKTVFSPEAALETMDGISLGFTNELSFGQAEVRVLAGQAKDRDHGVWVEASNDTVSFKTDAEKILGGSLALSTEFGKFRLAYLETEIEDIDFDSLSFGYGLEKGNFFADAEVAMENIGGYTTGSDPISGNFATDTEVRKGYVTLGMHLGQFTPSVTYSQKEVEFSENNADEFAAVEAGVSYNIYKNMKLKAAYEHVEYGNDLDDSIVSLGMAAKF